MSVPGLDVSGNGAICCVRMNRLLMLAPLFLLMGAGCALPWSAPPASTVSAEPLCLSWSSPDGFRAWITAYADGNEGAVTLAQRIRLPAHADAKLMDDLMRSADAGGSPSFVCTLDEDGRNVAWAMEFPDTASDTCTDSFYVSIDGEGTTSDFTTTGRADDCTHLCKPKRLEENLLVWQCDLRGEETDEAAWTQLHMNRWTGEVDLLGCQEDALGLPSGCIR